MMCLPRLPHPLPATRPGRHHRGRSAAVGPRSPPGPRLPSSRRRWL